jgi:two-component system, LytTR family, sensor kinase
MTDRKKTEWKFILIGWAVYGVYMAVASYVISDRLGRPISWLLAIVNDFSYAALWVVITPLVLWLARRFRFERGQALFSFCIHLCASVLLSFVQKGVHWSIVAAYNAAVHQQPFSWNPLYRNLLSFYDYGLQLYWIVLAVNYAAEYYERYRQKELMASQLQSRLALAQLQTLKMQLHPHFLFNTLHTIAGLVRNDEKQKAVKMISGLSELLRKTLDSTDQQEVPLRQELDTIRWYLEIQQVRFSDCLHTQINVDPATLDALVPNLLLQPLVENAVVHGITPEAPVEGCTITISSVRENGTLQLEVRDNGPGLSSTQADGIGLSNTRARLEQLYGEKHSFEVRDVEGGGVRATILLPWHTT